MSRAGKGPLSTCPPACSGSAFPPGRRSAARALPEQDLLGLLIGREIVARSQFLAHLHSARNRRPIVHALKPSLKVGELREVLALVFVGTHPRIARHVGDRILAS